MKARAKELLDRAVAATVAAIEIYNKPDFIYREEAFTVLAINGWELLLKAKWLADNQNKISSLYVMEPRTKKDGTKSQKLQIKETRSGKPPKQFVEQLKFQQLILQLQRRLWFFLGRRWRRTWALVFRRNRHGSARPFRQDLCSPTLSV